MQMCSLRKKRKKRKKGKNYVGSETPPTSRKRRHFGPKYRMSTPTRSEKDVWQTPQQASTQQVQGQKNRHTHPHVQSRKDRFTNPQTQVKSSSLRLHFANLFHNLPLAHKISVTQRGGPGVCSAQARECLCS